MNGWVDRLKAEVWCAEEDGHDSVTLDLATAKGLIETLNAAEVARNRSIEWRLSQLEDRL